jgi:hypothetical protein
MNRHGCSRWVLMLACSACFACSSGSGDADKDTGGSGKTDGGGAGKAAGSSGGKGSGNGSNGTGSNADGGPAANAGADASVPMFSDAGGLDHVPPFKPTGDPLTADDMKWTWVDFADTKCRDGSMAGLGLSLNSKSDKLMIYLEGGGACFDLLTCLGNPTNADSMKGEHNAGIFARANAKNPVKDWNWIYVPYCTGDVHIGTKDDSNVQDVGPQHFVGRTNLTAFLNRIVPTFAHASQVLLTGVSAGGFGASANAEYVQWAFGDVPVTMVDDSGPTMTTKVVPSCLQKQWREIWGLEGSVLKDCGADCPNQDDFEIDYTKHVAARSSERMAGLISSTADMVITLFYGYGQNDCMGNAATPVGAAEFKAGLLEYRDILKTIYPNYGTYYIEDSKHTWIGDDGFYTTVTGANSRPLVDWVADIVNGKAVTHEGP